MTNETPIVRESKFIGELPGGYEYKFVRVDGILKVIGIAVDKEPIGFIFKNDKLEKMEIIL